MTDLCDTAEIYNLKKSTALAVLDVIAVISNPARFDRRYKLFNEFCDRMKSTPNVRLTTIELQQRARPYATDATIKFKAKSELWYKENLINVAVQHLPADWEYVAWIDADIEFQNKDWAQETIEQLQTYKIVQLFSHAIDLGPKEETMQVHTGFCYLYVNGVEMNNYRPGTPYRNGHTGYAFAMTKNTYNDMGGLLEIGILGSGDAHMCMAWIGQVKRTLNSKLHKNYKEICIAYEERCERHIKRNIGYVNGTILHAYHGRKHDRAYSSRWIILIENAFDPLRDIKKDNNNLWQLEDNKSRLRDDIRRYFRQRNEDSITMDDVMPFANKNWI
jgi:hypothetical protein